MRATQLGADLRDGALTVDEPPRRRAQRVEVHGQVGRHAGGGDHARLEGTETAPADRDAAVRAGLLADLVPALGHALRHVRDAFAHTGGEGLARLSHSLAILSRIQPK
jgi:hypothetical protein